MTSPTGRSDAGVVDVLYAVALGEGFFASMNGIREDLVAGEFLPFGSGGQTLSRVLLGFFIVILSWLYYRRAVIPGRDYPTSEFAIDIIVMVAYMAMLSFADSPAVFYSVIAVIWIMYVLARIAGRHMNKEYLAFNLGFVAFFVVLSATTFFDQRAAGEWLRVIMATIGVAAYRVLDVKLRARFRFD